MARDLDGKFKLENDQVVKKSNGEIVPEDEPLFIFRARDCLALDVLNYYYLSCCEDKCSQYQLELLLAQINKFKDFAKDHPEKMKQPGITLGK